MQRPAYCGLVLRETWHRRRLRAGFRQRLLRRGNTGALSCRGSDPPRGNGEAGEMRTGKNDPREGKARRRRREGEPN